MKIPSNHSLVNIPFLPSSPAPVPKTATIASLISPGADVPDTPRNSPPTRSRPSSPKSRIGTLKKRPMSLHASRPGSWHVDSPLGSSSIKVKKSGKGKRSSALIEEEGGGSSNDVSCHVPTLLPANSQNHSDVSAGNSRRGSKRVSRIPSLLLALFEPNSAKQSQGSLSVKSPTPSPVGHQVSPVPHEKEASDEIKGDGPPLEVIRTSGTFGIQDDGSTHLLSIEEPGSRPMTATSFTGRHRPRRDSDNGTVRSQSMGPALYMGNPDPPRESIDEGSEESAVYQTPPSSNQSCGPDDLHRSMTPFKPNHPTSPLEHILSTSPLSLEAVSPERRSVEGARALQVNTGRSDVSQRAQSPSTAGNSATHSRTGHVIDDETVMKDVWAQTSPAPSITSTRSKRPLPKPPADIPTSHARGPRARPTSLPPSAYAQPAPPPSSDLPLLIASHLLSNHATALMRHSTGLAEGAEMMKRMADESMQWGAVLLNMASGHQPGTGIPMAMPARPWSTDVQPDDGIPQSSSRGQEHGGMPSLASFASSIPSRPVFNPPPPPSRGPSSEDQSDDRYTPLPPRISVTRRTRSHVNLYTEFYDEVEHLGKKGWEEIHQAEDIWMRGMKDLKKFCDDGPEEGRVQKSPVAEEREQQGPARPPRRQLGSGDQSYRNSKRSGMTTSMIRTEESFLPSPTDLLPSPSTDAEVGGQTGTTDDSFLNLMTPPNPRIESDNDSTLRARAHPRVKVPFSRDSGISVQGNEFQPGTASTKSPSNSRGYESDQFLPHPAAYPILRMPPAPTPRSRTTQSEQIHQSYPSIRAQGEGVQSEKMKQKLRVNTFDLNTQPPIFPHQVEKSATESTTGTGTGGRKLRKRSSALHLNLATPGAQTPSDRQPSTAASTVKSKGSSRKKHWWSRRKEGTGESIDDLARGDWRGSLTAT
jgi:hypothetical protein